MKTHFLDDAEEEVREAIRWYESQRIGLGGEFLDEVGVAVARIEDSGGRCPLEECSPPNGIVRRSRLRRLTFRLVFFEREQRSNIVALVHHARQPGYWHQRLHDAND